MEHEQERRPFYTEEVKAGKRIYYFDVRQSQSGERFLSITESKKVVTGTFERPQVAFERHKIFLYKEDYEKFLAALEKTLQVAKAGELPPESDGVASDTSGQEAFDIEVDF